MVRDLLTTFFSHHKQDWDWVTENWNKRLKRAVLGNSARGWRVAGATLGLVEMCRARLAAVTGTRDHDEVERTQPDLEPVLRRAEKWAWQNMYATSDTPDSVKPVALDGKELVKGCENFYETGQELMRAAVTSMRATPASQKTADLESPRARKATRTRWQGTR